MPSGKAAFTLPLTATEAHIFGITHELITLLDIGGNFITSACLP